LVNGCSSRQIKQQPRRRPLPRRRPHRAALHFPLSDRGYCLLGDLPRGCAGECDHGGGASGSLLRGSCRQPQDAAAPAGRGRAAAGGGLTLVRFGLWAFDVPFEPKLWRVTNGVGPQFCPTVRGKSILEAIDPTNNLHKLFF
jgi:hypothetical protein